LENKNTGEMFFETPDKELIFKRKKLVFVTMYHSFFIFVR